MIWDERVTAVLTWLELLLCAELLLEEVTRDWVAVLRLRSLLELLEVERLLVELPETLGCVRVVAVRVLLTEVVEPLLFVEELD